MGIMESQRDPQGVPWDPDLPPRKDHDVRGRKDTKRLGKSLGCDVCMEHGALSEGFSPMKGSPRASDWIL